MFGLTKEDVERFSRQLLLKDIGSKGQMELARASVLIVGCGGLGCPCAVYLAAAGVGTIGLIDHDKVEISNLHRQILHTEARVGTNKADSIKEALTQLNSSVHYKVYDTKFDRTNALELTREYDIIVDASDNQPTRYLVSDVCVINCLPLVSGAALRFEGSLTVYNFHKDIPCFRCLHPVPQSPHTVTNCSDGGVLGVIPGIIGSLQALEVIKIIIKRQPTYAGKMLLFDGWEGTFKTVELRGKNKDCAVCCETPTIGEELIDYEAFCGTRMCEAARTLQLLEPDERITCAQYKEIYDAETPHLLIDVRPALESDIVSLDEAVNIPLDKLISKDGLMELQKFIDLDKADRVFFICRRGNASQKACRFVKASGEFKNVEFKDIIGGMTAYAKEVDPDLPIY